MKRSTFSHSLDPNRLIANYSFRAPQRMSNRKNQPAQSRGPLGKQLSRHTAPPPVPIPR